MPNGEPRLHASNRAETEKFFAPIADALAAFAERHNLKLEKYYHEAPSWSFAFRHPKGGVAKVEVSRTGQAPEVSCAWWYDDYDTLQRHIKGDKSGPVTVNANVIVAELERCLALVLSWRFGDWDKSYGGNDVWKATWTREQFLLLSGAYPIPR